MSSTRLRSALVLLCMGHVILCALFGTRVPDSTLEPILLGMLGAHCLELASRVVGLGWGRFWCVVEGCRRTHARMHAR